jgi:hypothetical protein
MVDLDCQPGTGATFARLPGPCPRSVSQVPGPLSPGSRGRVRGVSASYRGHVNRVRTTLTLEDVRRNVRSLPTKQ